MQLQPRPVKTIIITVLTLALGVVGAGTMLPYTAPLQQAKQIIGRSISKAVGMPVQIGQVEITSTGDIRLRRVQLTQTGVAASATANAGDVVVDLSIWHYFRTHDVLSSIKQVRVHSLELNLQGEQAAIAKLIPVNSIKSNTPGLPFPIVISDLSASWQAFTWSERLLELEPVATAGASAKVKLAQSKLTGPQLPTQLKLSGEAVITATGLADISLRAAAPAGTAHIAGALSLEKAGKWNLRADISKLALGQWLGAEAPNPFSANLQLGGPLAHPQMRISTSALRWHAWQADHLQAEVDLRQNALTIQSLLATRRRAAVSARGSLTLDADPALDLTVAATGVTRAEVPVLPASWPVDGTASFAGELAGSLRNPQLTGTVRLRNGKLWSTEFADAHAALRYSGEKLQFDAGSVTLPNAKTAAYLFSGSYKPAARMLNMQVNAHSLPASSALAWPQLQWPILGNIQGKVNISGPIDRLVYHIGVQSAAVTAWKQSLRNLDLQLEYSEGSTQVLSATASGLGGKLTGAGRVTGNALAMTFQATGVNLDKMLQAGLMYAQYYAPDMAPTLQQVQKLHPMGVAELNGTLRGSPRSPLFSAQFAVDNAQVAGVWAGGWEGKLSGPLGRNTPGNQWTLTDGHITLGSGSTSIAGKFTAQEPKTPAAINLAGEAERLSLAQAMPVARAVMQALGYGDLPAFLGKELTSSTVSGTWSTATMAGSKSMQLTGDLALVGKIAGYDYNAQMAGTGSSSALRLEQVRISAAGGSARLQGSVSKGDVRINGTWSDLPAAVVGVIAGLPQRLGGALSGSIDIESSAAGLTGSLAWQAPSITIGKSQFTQLSGQISADGGRMQLRQWRANAAGRIVQADGVLPMPAGLAAMLGIKPTDRLDLAITIPRGPLAPLYEWLDLLPAVRQSAGFISNLQAQGDVQLRIYGTTKAPQFSGTASFVNGTMALPAPWGRIDSAAGKLEFAGTKMRLTQASASILGGKLNAQAELTLRVGAAPLVQGKVDGELDPKLPGFSASGDINLQLAGALDDVRVSGVANVRKGDINLTELPAQSATSKTTTKARFDIELKLQQLRLRAASLVDVPVAGALKLTGTPHNLGLSGQLQTDRGRVNYLGTNFNIVEATADFAPFRGLMPELSVSGNAWIGRNVIALNMTGVPPALKVNLGSDPPMSQQEILALLKWPEQIDKLGSGDTGEMARGIVEALQGGLELSLMSGLEDVVRDSLGLDEFRLEPDFSERQIRLSAGKFLLPRIYMTYGRSLFTEPKEDLGLEYHLDNGWKLSAGLNDTGEARLGLEARIRF